MDKGRYISVAMQAVDNMVNKGVLSPSEGKRLCDDLLMNRKSDIMQATVIEAASDVRDSLESS